MEHSLQRLKNVCGTQCPAYPCVPGEAPVTTPLC